MGVLRLQGFSGTVPVSGDRALPDAFATESVNTWLYGGELRGLHPPVDLLSILTTTRRVMRVPKRTPGGDDAVLFPGGAIPPPSYLGDSIWMQFTDPDTDIVRGQLLEDRYERWYFCSPTTGPLFNTYARMVAGLSPYKLGVPGPNPVIGSGGTNPDKPTLSATGGAVPQVTRSYLYTWVNEFGEESAPSLPVTGTFNSGAMVTIGNIKDPPALGASYPVYSKKRLYRTQSSDAGVGDYYLVTEMLLPPTGVLTFADDTATLTDALVVNKLVLPSTTWLPPPDNLQGWIAMPNGFLVAFDKPDPSSNSGGNNIYMSEAYHFHAWPPAYKQATETPIVGLGVIGQTCVVCTQGYPATVTGIKPATCAFTKATTGEPALGRGSIVSTPSGVIYASQNGLILVGPNGIQNLTEQIITRDKWVKDFLPQYIRGVRYQNGYLAMVVEPPSLGQHFGFFLDPSELKVALTKISDMETVVAANVDMWSGEVFLLEVGNIMRWDKPSSDLMGVLWKSKEFQYAFQENFGCYAIYWDPARFSSNDWGDSFIDPAEHVRLLVYADRRLVYDEEVPRNGRPVRLGSGFKSDVWQFEIRARAPVYSLHVASTAKELKVV